MTDFPTQEEAQEVLAQAPSIPTASTALIGTGWPVRGCPNAIFVDLHVISSHEVRSRSERSRQSFRTLQPENSTQRLGLAILYPPP